MIAIIADDHPLFRVALSQACAAILGKDALLLQAQTMQQVWPLLRQHPDTHFIFLDLKMPGSDGFTGLTALRTEYPDVPVIMVSAEEDPVIIKQALALGAAAYIPKSAPLELLSEAINAVSNGDTWLPTELADDVKNARALIDHDFAQRLEQLTPQQFRVLKMIADGLLNKQIAYEMNVQETTIKQHVSAILRKLNVNNRTLAGILFEKLKLPEQYD
ncbi:response regulator transcription factor [Alishewanella sp. SMS8]|uniref:response regulator transcription factor n=1 Tax=unclassified Alishewanella TaxID=2628974 RepID=UPI0027406FCE|nr:response regulator transcription factor [Alishewanella sp. SMS8]MDP4945131.1 response regulator transcription factor [Alishewanella sp.]MDP5206235.1 response regulator transcription factor [Alishewanella sp. SMS9]MDP5034922.1 response regulator transcription factor [Alishewanella sp.]MDP5188276.1 response regulator transcription factor [Alishewanella sp.]MDP5458814.1 response regulator transcription factor [Alishewanella sp. SMS8]